SKVGAAFSAITPAMTSTWRSSGKRARSSAVARRGFCAAVMTRSLASRDPIFVRRRAREPGVGACIRLLSLTEVRPALERIEKRDKNLGNQMLRASESMCLNLAEGSYSQGGNKRVHFNSLGSTPEVLSC